ncbi:MAG TPA: hypothetical protein VFV72_11035 [Candidatus Limnocylindrales bacterium]|nr:hypothetical protein [Candidatus Limnocylindrales bacterium]
MTRFTVVAAVVAALVGACGPEPFVDEGTTFGASESFDVDAGTQTISWSAWDATEPVDGCLFGLLLDPEDAGPDSAAQAGFQIPKLAYDVLGAGDARNGQAVLELPAGRYRFVVEGSCWWSLRVDRH